MKLKRSMAMKQISEGKGSREPEDTRSKRYSGKRICEKGNGVQFWSSEHRSCLQNQTFEFVFATEFRSNDTYQI